MPVNEFEIIAHYFKSAYPTNKGNLVLGIGDDAAIINVTEDTELVLSTDTLVSGVHFFENTAAEDIAYKSLNVNLSDIAAMGALPRWVTLSLTLPEKNLDWLSRFSSSFNQVAEEHGLTLVGGDLTKGPLSITIQVHGVSPKGKSLRRSGAADGDLIYVTGELGAAAYALKHLDDKTSYPTITEHELLRLNRPDARVNVGIELRDNATSCIDISDGLSSDLMHILNNSHVGADINLSKIPLSNSLSKLDYDEAIEIALTGGDDYELCFTLPKVLSDSALEELKSICPVHCIGQINKEDSKLNLFDKDNNLYQLKNNAYRHFN